MHYGWHPHSFTIIYYSTHIISTLLTVMLWKKTSISSVDKDGFVSHSSPSAIATKCPFFLFVLIYISVFPCSFCSLGADSCVAKAFFSNRCCTEEGDHTPLSTLQPLLWGSLHLLIILRWPWGDQSITQFLIRAQTVSLTQLLRQISNDTQPKPQDKRLSLISAQIRLGVVMSGMARGV